MLITNNYIHLTITLFQFLDISKEKFCKPKHTLSIILCELNELKERTDILPEINSVATTNFRDQALSTTVLYITPSQKFLNA